MATTAYGFQAASAFAKAATWGTPVVCGPRDKIEILAETVKSEVELVQDPSFNGSAVPSPGDAGNEEVKGFEDYNLKYEDKGLLPLAMVFGDDAAPVASGTLWKHVLRLAPFTDGLFGTLVISRAFEVWEYDTIKPISFELSSDAKSQFVKCKVDGIGRSMARNVGAGTNTVATFATVTNAYTVKRSLKFGQCKLYMNAVGGAALDTTPPTVDEICISDFVFTVKRPTEGDRTTCNAGLVQEPTMTDFAEVTLKATIPSYNSDHGVLYDLGRSKAVQKALLEFTLEAGADDYKMSFFLPSVQLSTEGPQADNAGKLPFVLNMQGWLANAVPTGMAFTDAVYCEIINGYGAGTGLLDEATYA
jgi:hypothetical protein